MKRTLLIIMLGLISNSVYSAPELKGSPQDLRGFLHPAEKIVTISGQAEERAYSDKAIVSLVISTEDKRLAQAISDNSLLRDKITKSLVTAGIQQDEIKSSKFSSSPQYGWFGSKPSSYKVVNRMAITISQETQLKEIALVADNHIEVELSDTEFKHTYSDDYNDKVKIKALKKVMKQKKYYEHTLGLKLTPIGIRDSNILQQATRGAMILDEFVVSAANQEKSGYATSVKGKRQGNRSSFDEVKYEANLSVDFKVEQ
ncbi:MAG: SIMPL domain-containing protein [Candidatus Thiodiazotropha sp. (ex Semelilucina semeliformis)]|nr:SIMPL domain-containing protein [Candidatus Thiodiazotropha sp. (ex Semelilucina semeliformis)]